jgi:hypothetical protein
MGTVEGSSMNFSIKDIAFSKRNGEDYVAWTTPHGTTADAVARLKADGRPEWLAIKAAYEKWIGPVEPVNTQKPTAKPGPRRRRKAAK